MPQHYVKYTFNGYIGGLVSEKSTFFLRIEENGTLRGQVKQIMLQRKRKRVQIYQRNANNSIEDTWNNTDNQLQTIATIHGIAELKNIEHIHDMSQMIGCKFHITALNNEINTDSICCIAILSPSRGQLSGTWVPHSKKNCILAIENLDLRQAKYRSFRFLLRQVSTEESSQNNITLLPLSAGIYEFCGYAKYSNSTNAKEEYFLTLQLNENGTLSGQSRESGQPQLCHVTGTWKTDTIQYLLEYRVNEEVGHFKYIGHVADTMITGTWRNLDAPVNELYRNGRGQFSIKATSILRDDNKLLVNPKQRMSLRGSKFSGLNMKMDALKPCNFSTRVTKFTTGEYTFKGKVLDHDGYVYDCSIMARFLSDGSLTGECSETIFSQQQKIIGEWTNESIFYEQNYVVHGETGTYVHKGTLGEEGDIVSGTWRNKALCEEFQIERKMDIREIGERGTFSYAIVQVNRIWSVRSHLQFPLSFRAAVECILFSSLHKRIIPTVLWYRIFEMCGDLWFDIKL